MYVNCISLCAINDQGRNQEFDLSESCSVGIIHKLFIASFTPEVVNACLHGAEMESCVEMQIFQFETPRLATEPQLVHFP
jgi:hypothetical protein